MCLVIIPICPCGYDGQRGATLPCVKAFAHDRKFRYRLHKRELWHKHFDKCTGCWTWWQYSKLRGVPTPACGAREWDFQEGEYQVFCHRVCKRKQAVSCCEDCSGPQCRIGSGMGTIMQETSATATSRKDVVSTNDVDATTTTTSDSADRSGPCCSSRSKNQPFRTANPSQGRTGGIVCPPSGKLDWSDSSDRSSEMSCKSKARTTKAGLLCRAFASLKAFVVQQDKN